MPNLEVEVMVDDNHLFIVEIESVLQTPEVGSVVTCRVCRMKRRVTKVGTPGRKGRTPRQSSEGQTSILKE